MDLLAGFGLKIGASKSLDRASLRPGVPLFIFKLNRTLLNIKAFRLGTVRPTLVFRLSANNKNRFSILTCFSTCSLMTNYGDGAFYGCFFYAGSFYGSLPSMALLSMALNATRCVALQSVH